MTVGELNEVLNELKKEGMSEENIIKSFAMAFIHDELYINACEEIIGCMGLSLDKKFKDLSKTQQKKV